MRWPPSVPVPSPRTVTLRPVRPRGRVSKPVIPPPSRSCQWILSQISIICSAVRGAIRPFSVASPMILAFGSVNIDLTVPVPALPQAGETVLGSDYVLVPGGKGANQALAACRAGSEVLLAGAVGRDLFAEIATSLLRRGGVDLDLVRTVEPSARRSARYEDHPRDPNGGLACRNRSVDQTHADARRTMPAQSCACAADRFGAVVATRFSRCERARSSDIGAGPAGARPPASAGARGHPRRAWCDCL